MPPPSPAPESATNVAVPARVFAPPTPAPARSAAPLKSITLLPSPAMARSSTRCAVTRIAAFFALAAAVLVGAGQAVNRGLRRIETSGFGVTNRIMAGQVNAEIVISGSSRALTHYDPRIIEEVTGCSAFNIGRNGSQTDLQVAVLKAYLKHNARPRLLIHNLDLFSFATSHEIYDPAQYLPYLDDDALYQAVNRVYPDAWKWKYLPLYGYVVEDMRFTWLLGIGALAGVQPAENHFRGYNPRFTPWTGDFERFAQANPNGVMFPIERRGLGDMAELLRVAAAEGIPVLLVYSPEFYDIQALERNRAVVFDRFHALGREFHAPIWDYSDSPITRDRANFYNSQHLNAQGAAIFSRDLAERLARSDLLAPVTSPVPN